MKFLVSLAIFSVMIISSQAHACSCEFLSMENFREFIKDADSVILGVPSQDSQSIGIGEWEVEEVKTKMSIVKNFKGKHTSTIDLVSLKSDGGNCGVDFKKYDGLYLIFSYLEEGKYVTSGCDVEYIDYENEELTRVIQEI